MSNRESKPNETLVELLTRRERDVLALLAEELTSPEIAERLTLATSSVKTHIQHLYGKLGVNSKRQAVKRARELGLLKSDERVLQGFPSPAEVKLLEPTLTTIAVPRAGPGRPRQKPERLIADRGWRGAIELVVPHRKNRKKPPTQDGRKLRRYRRRWKVERTRCAAWFGNFRRLVMRWERSLLIYLAFFHLACLLITINRL